jgi:hypothetical protein
VSRARQMRRLGRAHPAPVSVPRKQRAHVKLALAAAAWFFACQTRPMTVDSPAEDAEAEARWNAYTDNYLEERDVHLNGMDRPAQEAALSVLRDDKYARVEAARTVQHRYTSIVLPLGVHVWGPGWSDVPLVYLSRRDQIR